MLGRLRLMFLIPPLKCLWYLEESARGLGSSNSVVWGDHTP